VSESFGTLGAEALESRCRRLWRVFGVLGFIESWCGRLSASTRFGGLFGVRSPECSERAAPTWLKEQVSGRLESSGRFAVSETRPRDSWLSIRSRRAAKGQWLRSRGQRPERETSWASVLGEPRTAVRKAPGGATNPKRGAVAGKV